MRQILAFSLPTLGIWIASPLLSLMDTAFVGRYATSLELAALGPATAICNQLTSVFLFLGVATTNLLTGAVADEDPAMAIDGTTTGLAVAWGVGSALLVALAVFAQGLCRSFAGEASAAVVPAATTYVSARAWGLPFVLATVVAQAACLGYKQSSSALNAVGVSVAVNAVLDYLFVPVFRWGIAGAAWATVLSQVAGLASMLSALRNKVLRPLVHEAAAASAGASGGGGALPLATTSSAKTQIPWKLPSPAKAWDFVKFAGPIFFTNLGKFAPYTFATLAVSQAAGALPLAGHQVMLGVYFTFVMFSEPMGMTAQAFVPDALAATRKLAKEQQEDEEARGGQEGRSSATVSKPPTPTPTPTPPVVPLLRRIFAISAAISALVAGAACVGPALFPGTFTVDPLVVREMHRLVPLMFLLILPHPLTMCFEGVLLACRDIKYLTTIYAFNTLAVAGIMRFIATRSGGFGGGGGGGTVRAVWMGLIVWNTARCLEEGLRIVAHGKKLVGVSVSEVLFGNKERKKAN